MKSKSLDSPPIIGIDISPFSNPVTGIARYTLEVVKRLVIENRIQWILYSNKYNEEFKTLEASHVKLKLMNIPILNSRLLWSQILLPILLRRDEVNLFWSPTHRCPQPSSKYPTVITIHDLNWSKVPTTMKYISRILDMTLMPRAVKGAKKIITVSRSTAIDLNEAFNGCANKTYPIHLGSNGNSHVGRLSKEEPDYSNMTRYMLFVGTLEPRKNLTRIIEAYSLLPTHIRMTCKLFIVGGTGWGLESIHDICKRFNKTQDVIILGYVSESHLDSLYKNALFLAMPSLYEGFGLPIVEAMKHGVPSLVSNISSMPEVAGNASLQVDPYSVISIRDGMLTMICEEELREKLKNNARIRRHKFDWDITAKKTLDVFWSVLQTEQVE